MSNFDPKKQYQTRSGLKAEYLCDINVTGSPSKTAFLIHRNNGDRVVEYRKEGGEYPVGLTSGRGNDIVPVVEKTSKFVNVYRTGNMQFRDTREEADKHRIKSICIGLIEVLFEDGVAVSSVFHKVDE